MEMLLCIISLTYWATSPSWWARRPAKFWTTPTWCNSVCSLGWYPHHFHCCYCCVHLDEGFPWRNCAILPDPHRHHCGTLDTVATAAGILVPPSPAANSGQPAGAIRDTARGRYRRLFHWHRRLPVTLNSGRLHPPSPTSTDNKRLICTEVLQHWPLWCSSVFTASNSATTSNRAQ